MNMLLGRKKLSEPKHSVQNCYLGLNCTFSTNSLCTIDQSIDRVLTVCTEKFMID